MNTYDYIIDKYNLKIGRRYIVEIPNVGRNDLAELVNELGFKKIVEVGVFNGKYSEIICKANPDAQIFSVDPWASEAYEPDTYSNAEQKYYDERYDESVKRLAPYKNCTIVRKTSLEAMKDFEDDSLDFVYIDANHSFVNVAQDIHGWSKKVKPGGIVAGHDYAFFSYDKYNHVKRVLPAYARCYRIIPFFIAGSFECDTVSGKPTIRDKYRSWFWVKKGKDE